MTAHRVIAMRSFDRKSKGLNPISERKWGFLFFSIRGNRFQFDLSDFRQFCCLPKTPYA